MMVPLALRPFTRKVRSLANPYHDDGGRFTSEGGGAETTARRGVRPVSTPHISVTEAARISRGSDHAKAYVADVPVGLLVATQSHVQPNLVHAYVKTKQQRLDRPLTRADVHGAGQGHAIPPKVLAYKGRYYVADGQHRAEAAIQRREPNLHAIVIPVNPEWVDKPPGYEPYLERIKHLFDEKEPRDDHGRWTDGGGDGVLAHPDVKTLLAKHPWAAKALEQFGKKYGKDRLLRDVQDHNAEQAAAALKQAGPMPTLEFQQALIDGRKAIMKEQRAAKRAEILPKVHEALAQRGFKVGDKVFDEQFGHRGVIKIGRDGRPFVESPLGQHPFGVRWKKLDLAFDPDQPRGPIADALAAQPAWVQRVMEEHGSIRVRDVQDERPYTINGDITIASSAKPDEILGDVSHEIGHVLLYLCPAATADSAFVTAFEADQAEAKTKTKQELGAFGYQSLRYHIEEEAFAELYANAIGAQTKRLDIAGGQPVKTYFPRTFAVVQAWIEKEMPLHLAFDPEQPRADDGKWAGAGDHEHQARVARALAQYKPSTHEKRVHAQASEEAVVKMIRGEPTGDNAPTDVTVKINGRVHGVEVKTFLDNTNDKITMHPESLARKVAWAARAHATLHTVLLDKRDTFGTPGYSGHRLYYHRGAGAFRLSGMTPVRDAAHLRALMRES